MKNIVYLLLIFTVGLTSCGKMDNLSSFSKRKYFKKPPRQQEVVNENLAEIKPEAKANIIASTEIEGNSLLLEAESCDDLLEVEEFGKSISKEFNEVTFKKRRFNSTSIAKKIIHHNINRPDEDKPKTNVLAVFSFLFIFTGPGIVLSLPFAIIGLSQIKRNPEKYGKNSGKGWAIAAIVLFILIALFLIIVAASGGVYSG